ncbi:unnamed protein product [Amoebophrya sp. A120]|nr:unnamed protein product [Amoebophrya sp. A120]|eukprot:GSA120T00015562001.1
MRFRDVVIKDVRAFLKKKYTVEHVATAWLFYLDYKVDTQLSAEDLIDACVALNDDERDLRNTPLGGYIGSNALELLQIQHQLGAGSVLQPAGLSNSPKSSIGGSGGQKGSDSNSENENSGAKPSHQQNFDDEVDHNQNSARLQEKFYSLHGVSTYLDLKHQARKELEELERNPPPKDESIVRLEYFYDEDMKKKYYIKEAKHAASYLRDTPISLADLDPLGFRMISSFIDWLLELFKDKEHPAEDKNDITTRIFFNMFDSVFPKGLDRNILREAVPSLETLNKFVKPGSFADQNMRKYANYHIGEKIASEIEQELKDNYGNVYCLDREIFQDGMRAFHYPFLDDAGRLFKLLDVSQNDQLEYWELRQLAPDLVVKVGGNSSVVPGSPSAAAGVATPTSTADHSASATTAGEVSTGVLLSPSMPKTKKSPKAAMTLPSKEEEFAELMKARQNRGELLVDTNTHIKNFIRAVYGEKNPLRAWQDLARRQYEKRLDPSEITKSDFLHWCGRVQYHGNKNLAWKNMDKDEQGTVSIEEFDVKAAVALTKLQAFYREKFVSFEELMVQIFNNKKPIQYQSLFKRLTEKEFIHRMRKLDFLPKLNMESAFDSMLIKASAAVCKDSLLVHADPAFWTFRLGAVCRYLNRYLKLLTKQAVLLEKEKQAKLDKLRQGQGEVIKSRDDENGGSGVVAGEGEHQESIATSQQDEILPLSASGGKRAANNQLTIETGSSNSPSSGTRMNKSVTVLPGEQDTTGTTSTSMTNNSATATPTTVERVIDTTPNYFSRSSSLRRSPAEEPQNKEHEHDQQQSSLSFVNSFAETFVTKIVNQGLDDLDYGLYLLEKSYGTNELSYGTTPSSPGISAFDEESMNYQNFENDNEEDVDNDNLFGGAAGGRTNEHEDSTNFPLELELKQLETVIEETQNEVDEEENADNLDEYNDHNEDHESSSRSTQQQRDHNYSKELLQETLAQEGMLGDDGSMIGIAASEGEFMSPEQEEIDHVAQLHDWILAEVEGGRSEMGFLRSLGNLDRQSLKAWAPTVENHAVFQGLKNQVRETLIEAGKASKKFRKVVRQLQIINRAAKIGTGKKLQHFGDVVDEAMLVHALNKQQEWQEIDSSDEDEAGLQTAAKVLSSDDEQQGSNNGLHQRQSPFNQTGKSLLSVVSKASKSSFATATSKQLSTSGIGGGGDNNSTKSGNNMNELSQTFASSTIRSIGSLLQRVQKARKQSSLRRRYEKKRSEYFQFLFRCLCHDGVYVQPKDFLFLQRWQPPLFLNAKPDAEGFAALQKILRLYYGGNDLFVWRNVDADLSQKVIYSEFEEAATLSVNSTGVAAASVAWNVLKSNLRKHDADSALENNGTSAEQSHHKYAVSAFGNAFQQQKFRLSQLPGAWVHLDKNLDGFVTITQYAPETATILKKFFSFCALNFGGYLAFLQHLVTSIHGAKIATEILGNSSKKSSSSADSNVPAELQDQSKSKKKKTSLQNRYSSQIGCLPFRKVMCKAGWTGDVMNLFDLLDQKQEGHIYPSEIQWLQTLDTPAFLMSGTTTSGESGGAANKQNKIKPLKDCSRFERAPVLHDFNKIKQADDLSENKGLKPQTPAPAGDHASSTKKSTNQNRPLSPTAIKKETDKQLQGILTHGRLESVGTATSKRDSESSIITQEQADRYFHLVDAGRVQNGKILAAGQGLHEDLENLTVSDLPSESSEMEEVEVFDRVSNSMKTIVRKKKKKRSLTRTERMQYRCADEQDWAMQTLEDQENRRLLAEQEFENRNNIGGVKYIDKVLDDRTAYDFVLEKRKNRLKENRKMYGKSHRFADYPERSERAMVYVRKATDPVGRPPVMSDGGKKNPKPVTPTSPNLFPDAHLDFCTGTNTGGMSESTRLAATRDNSLLSRGSMMSTSSSIAFDESTTFSTVSSSGGGLGHQRGDSRGRRSRNRRDRGRGSTSNYTHSLVSMASYDAIPWRGREATSKAAVSSGHERMSATGMITGVGDDEYASFNMLQRANDIGEDVTEVTAEQRPAASSNPKQSSLSPRIISFVADEEQYQDQQEEHRQEENVALSSQTTRGDDVVDNGAPADLEPELEQLHQLQLNRKLPDFFQDDRPPTGSTVAPIGSNSRPQTSATSASLPSAGLSSSRPQTNHSNSRPQTNHSNSRPHTNHSNSRPHTNHSTSRHSRVHKMLLEQEEFQMQQQAQELQEELPYVNQNQDADHASATTSPGPGAVEVPAAALSHENSTNSSNNSRGFYNNNPGAGTTSPGGSSNLSGQQGQPNTTVNTTGSSSINFDPFIDFGSPGSVLFGEEFNGFVDQKIRSWSATNSQADTQSLPASPSPGNYYASASATGPAAGAVLGTSSRIQHRSISPGAASSNGGVDTFHRKSSFDSPQTSVLLDAEYEAVRKELFGDEDPKEKRTNRRRSRSRSPDFDLLDLLPDDNVGSVNDGTTAGLVDQTMEEANSHAAKNKTKNKTSSRKSSKDEAATPSRSRTPERPPPYQFLGGQYLSGVYSTSDPNLKLQKKDLFPSRHRKAKAGPVVVPGGSSSPGSNQNPNQNQEPLRRRDIQANLSHNLSLTKMKDEKICIGSIQPSYASLKHSTENVCWNRLNSVEDVPVKPIWKPTLATKLRSSVQKQREKLYGRPGNVSRYQEHGYKSSYNLPVVLQPNAQFLFGNSGRSPKI